MSEYSLDDMCPNCLTPWKCNGPHIPKKEAVSERQETILEEAQRIVYGDREQTYGHPAKNFEITAALWNAWLDGKYQNHIGLLDVGDVAMMMMLLKVARQAHQNKRDNLVDACGYIACIQKIEDYGKLHPDV